MSGCDPSSAAFFDEKYRSSSDPWAFGTDAYELARYDRILDHVDAERHRRVFEPGCSIGVLTELLGRRCAAVDATDLSPAAVRRARERCRHHPGVTVAVGDLHPPAAHYDLIVLSEIGYYLTSSDLAAAVAQLADRVVAGGRLIAAHWIGTSPDHRLHGDDVHEVVATVLAGWRHRAGGVHPHPTKDGYRLDVWDRP